MRKNIPHNKGFTILETIVAVLILGISIVSMVVVMGGGAQKAIHNKDRLVASYLAQEGIELVRNVRDTIFLIHEDDPGIGARWDIFKDELGECFDGSCAVSYDFGADLGEIPVIISSGDEVHLKFDAETGRYSYESGTETMFTRSVRVTPIGDDVARVNVTVTYREGTESRSYSTSEVLFNWF